jgi:hypothetical protein
MNSVEIEKKSFEMPPRDGLTIAYFLTVAEVGRSADFYETVLGGRILSRGIVTAHPATFRSRMLGLLSTLGAGRHPRSRR